MESQTSPSKRRVLAPIDANTKSPATATARSAASPSKPRLLKPLAAPRLQGSGTKRPFEEDLDKQKSEGLSQPQRAQSRPFKKPTIPSMPAPQDNIMSTTTADDEVPDCGGSDSPADSSVFDNPLHDTSAATIITEPDVAAAPTIPPTPFSRPRAMTREETRHKAELLRLRLGLASYKVRTGQTDVPLEQLQVKPLSRWALPSSSTAAHLSVSSSSDRHAPLKSTNSRTAGGTQLGEGSVHRTEDSTSVHEGTTIPSAASHPPQSPPAPQWLPPASISAQSPGDSKTSKPI